MNYFATLENARKLLEAPGWKEHYARLTARVKDLHVRVECAKDWEDYLDARSRARELRDAMQDVERMIAVCEAAIAEKKPQGE